MRLQKQFTFRAASFIKVAIIPGFNYGKHSEKAKLDMKFQNKTKFYTFHSHNCCFFLSLSLLLDSFRSLQAKATETKRNNCAKAEPENTADPPERAFFFPRIIEFKENCHFLYLCTKIILITGKKKKKKAGHFY